MCDHWGVVGAGPRVSSATQVWAAVSAELADRGGEYVESCGVSDAVAPYANDAEHAAELWAQLRQCPMRHAVRYDARRTCTTPYLASSAMIRMSACSAMVNPIPIA
jgi:hypothetical protein